MGERIHVDTRSGYDRWAVIYDDDLNPLVLLEQDVVREWMLEAAERMGIYDGLGSRKDSRSSNADSRASNVDSRPSGLRVADVGCGTGRHSVWLADQGARVHAFDFSSGMLSKAREKLERHGVAIHEHALPAPLPCETGEFDVTLFALVADHIADPVPVFVDLRRATRAGGIGVFTMLHPAMNLLGLTARFTDPETGHEVRVKAFEHTYADYVLAVLRAGWEIEDIAERKADAALVSKTPRAEKYLGWPLLLAMKLRNHR